MRTQKPSAVRSWAASGAVGSTSIDITACRRSRILIPAAIPRSAVWLLSKNRMRGSFGIALFGAIFAGRLHDTLAGRLGEAAAERYASGGTGAVASPAAIEALPAPIRDGLLASLAESISGVFGWALLITVAVPVLAWFIKEVPLRGGPEAYAPGEPTRAEGVADTPRTAVSVAD